MKKVVSIAAVALMAFGLTSYVAENTANEFEIMSEINSMLACGNCSTTNTGHRDPPKNVS
jgi:hypothetical protein